MTIASSYAADVPMEHTNMELEIGFLVFPKFQILDLTGPLAAFQVASKLSGQSRYRLRILSMEGGPIESSSGLVIFTEPARSMSLDTLVVVGGGDLPDRPELAAELAELVLKLAPASRRIGSVCTGAFVLAEAGLLNMRTATTHWRHSLALQKRYPQIKVDSDRIFTRDGQYWTSAGISAGIDFALALIEDDLGVDLSRDTARELVVFHRRPGGQSQFSTLLELNPESDRIRIALSYAREHLHEKLSIERLADIACLSPRHFSRSFLSETGETPAKAVERLRTEAARLLIETTVDPIEEIAQKVGYIDPERMRRAFVRMYGHPPQGIRRAARTLHLHAI
jgi:transcriptional regulator GlxA family with amidase domain